MEQGGHMGSIITYKNALPYRDEACGLAVSPKINAISSAIIAKH